MSTTSTAPNEYREQLLEEFGDTHPEDAEPFSDESFYDRDRVIAELADLAKMDVIPTGFAQVDTTIGGGLFVTQLTTLVAPTGVGKSSMAMQIAQNTTAPVLVWTLEMPPTLLAARAAAQVSGDSSLAIVRNPETQARNLVHIPHGIHYYRGRSSDTVRGALKSIAPEGGALLVVDYLQKAAISTADAEVRAAVTAISEELRSLAIDEECAVLAISSTSRQGTSWLYQSKDKAPHELEGCGKESGAIEYDSATVITLGPDPEVEPLGSSVILTVAKARFGLKGQFEFKFEGAQGRWTEVRKLPSRAKRDIETKADDMLEAIKEKYRETGEPMSQTTICEKLGRGTKQKRTQCFELLLERGSLVPEEFAGLTRYRPAIGAGS